MLEIELPEQTEDVLLRFTQEGCREDFRFFYDRVCRHPAMRRSVCKEEIAGKYDVLLPNVKDRESLIAAMTELSVALQDGHTNIELPYMSTSQCLNIPCEWVYAEKQPLLVLKDSWQDVPKRSVIKEICGVSIERIRAEFGKIIPHENQYLVMSRMIEYPYANYHMFSAENMRRLFGEQESYRIHFAFDGDFFQKECKLENYNGFFDFCDEDFIAFELQEKTLILYLKSCVFNDVYINKLHEAAELSVKEAADTLLLDLSDNMGGNSAVIDEFIRHVNIPFFHRYEMIDYSGAEPVVRTRRADKAVNQPYEDCFPKNILCKVGYTTFSSARTFAVTLKDNGIAKIIGSPTGGKPDSYGLPKRFVTPNCNIRFRVSSCEFLRPDPSGDGEDALYPEELKW